MGTIHVSAQQTIDAPAGEVYLYISDMREHHPHFLPDAFQDFKVEEGGLGTGTIVTFKVNAGKRVRAYRMRIEEPEPGRVLTENDENSSLVTRFTVQPQGEASRVSIETTWQGAGGVGGFFERTFAPKGLTRVYGTMLERLDEELAAG